MAQAAQAAATQALYERQGFPPAAARNAAQTFLAGSPPDANPSKANNNNNKGSASSNNNNNMSALTVSSAQNAVSNQSQQQQQQPQQQQPTMPFNMNLNPWAYIMAMQNFSACAPATVNNTPVPAPAMQPPLMNQNVNANLQSFQDFLMAMQQFSQFGGAVSNMNNMNMANNMNMNMNNMANMNMNMGLSNLLAQQQAAFMQQMTTPNNNEFKAPNGNNVNSNTTNGNNISSDGNHE
jgi:hypothetical protein